MKNITLLGPPPLTLSHYENGCDAAAYSIIVGRVETCAVVCLRTYAHEERCNQNAGLCGVFGDAMWHKF